MLMPAMLLTTACSSEDDALNNTANSQPVANKGYALPVTVNVTREGDKGSNRASYTDNGDKTGSLAFSAGDQLFVAGSDSKAGDFAGLLTWQSEGTFSGTIMTENEYDGTAEELLSSATDGAEALLIPAGYKSYEYLELDDEITSDAGYYCNKDNAFALTKAAAVEQFSFELAETYSSGFTLSPQNAIVSFTISGLTANKEVAVSFNPIDYVVISKNVTTSAEGVATFAIGLDADVQLGGTLTVDGNNIAMPTKTTEAGHIYNISRSAAPATDLSTISSDYEVKNGEVLTGTLGSNVKISIADGATVTLKDVDINGSGTWKSGEYAGITCAGNATIILEGTNSVKGFDEDYPGIFAAEGKTLTIQGTGSLNVSSNGIGAAGIGGGEDGACGNIVISGGTITATGGEGAAGIGSGQSYDGNASCGNITISGGTITATGGDDAAGIGSGSGNTTSGVNRPSTCGTITITSGVTQVTATKGSGATNSIGSGKKSTCGTVTIGGTEYWDGSDYKNDGDTYLTTSPLTYPAAP